MTLPLCVCRRQRAILNLIHRAARGMSLREIAARRKQPVHAERKCVNGMADAGLIRAVDDRWTLTDVGALRLRIANAMIRAKKG